MYFINIQVTRRGESRIRKRGGEEEEEEAEENNNKKKEMRRRGRIKRNVKKRKS